MGNARFLTNNLITSSAMITPSSERPGQIGLPVKIGSGAAAMTVAGSYTGDVARQYIVEANDLTGGPGIGSAKFRWRRADDPAWMATGVATSSAPVVLENGISVSFAAATAPAFVTGDYWTITAAKAFGRANLLDLDRNTEWRGLDGSVDAFLYFDLGSSQRVDAVALLDTNFLTNAQTVWIGGSNDLGTLLANPLYYGAPYGSTNLVHYLTGTRTYRYWGLYMYAALKSDAYFRIGSLYLGTYTEFTGNFDRGWVRTPAASIYGPTGSARSPRGIWATTETIDLSYKGMTTADRDAARALFSSLYDQSVGLVRPAIVNLDSADPADVSLYDLQSPELPIASPSLGRFEWQLRLAQRARVARSGS